MATLSDYVRKQGEAARAASSLSYSALLPKKGTLTSYVQTKQQPSYAALAKQSPTATPNVSYAELLNEEKRAQRGVIGNVATGAGKGYIADIANAGVTVVRSIDAITDKLRGETTDPNIIAREARQDARRSAVQDWSDTTAESAQKDIQAAHGAQKWGAVGDVLIDAGVSGLQMGGDALLAAATGGSSLGMMFTRVYGGSAREARQSGANLAQQNLYGIASGAVEVLTEKMFDGVAGVYGKGAASTITEAVVQKLGKTAMGKTALRVLIGAAGEGAEEAVSDLVHPFVSMLKGLSWQERERLDVGELGYDFIVGAVSGMFGGGGAVITGQNAQANRVLAQENVDKAITSYWDVVKDKGAMSRKARESYETMGAAMSDAEAVQSLLDKGKAVLGDGRKTTQAQLYRDTDGTWGIQAVERTGKKRTNQYKLAGFQTREAAAQAAVDGAHGRIPMLPGIIEEDGEQEEFAGKTTAPQQTAAETAAPPQAAAETAAPPQAAAETAAPPQAAAETAAPPQAAAESAKSETPKKPVVNGDAESIAAAMEAEFKPAGFRTEAYAKKIIDAAEKKSKLIEADRQGRIEKSEAVYAVANALSAKGYEGYTATIARNENGAVVTITAPNGEQTKKQINGAESAQNGYYYLHAARDIVDKLGKHAPQTKEEVPFRRVEIDYTDTKKRNAAQKKLHDKMLSEGKAIDLTKQAEGAAEYFPDLRSMPKKERTAILKGKITELKERLRAYLNTLTKGKYEFTINGTVMEARLYSTGINEVLEKVTQKKAGMLSVSDLIFRSVEYLYSTQDKSGDSNVEVWDYFYVPVTFGEETAGVRVAVRRMITPEESQIYNWKIKNDATLGGGGHTQKSRTSADASSVASESIVPQGNSKSKADVATETDVEAAKNVDVEVKRESEEAAPPMSEAPPVDVNANLTAQSIAEARQAAYTDADGNERHVRVVQAKDGTWLSGVTIMTSDGDRQTNVRGGFASAEEAAKAAMEAKTKTRAESGGEAQNYDRTENPFPPQNGEINRAGQYMRLPRDEARMVAAEEGYPMLTRKNGAQEQAVPGWSWVQSKERGNYGRVVGMENGRLIVRFFNKTEGTEAEVVMTPGEVTAVDAELSDDDAAEERIEHLEKSAPEERDDIPGAEEDEEWKALRRAEETEKDRRDEQDAIEALLAGDEANDAAAREDALRDAEPDEEGIEMSDAEKAVKEVENASRIAEDIIITKSKKSGESLMTRFIKTMRDFKAHITDTAAEIDRMGKDTNSNLYAWLNAARASSAAAAAWMTDGTTDSRGMRTGASLQEVLAPARKDEKTYEKFQKYLLLQHHADRMSLAATAEEIAEAYENLDFFDNEIKKKWEFAGYKTGRAEAREAAGKSKASGRSQAAAQAFRDNMPVTDMTYQQLVAEIENRGLQYEQAKERKALLDKITELNKKQNKPVLGWDISAEDARQEAARLEAESPEFKEWAQGVYGYTKRLMDYRVGLGLVTQESVDAWAKMYPHYVPTNRVIDEDSPKSRKGAIPESSIVLGRSVKKASGSEAPILRLDVNLARQTMDTLRTGAKDEVGHKLLQLWDEAHVRGGNAAKKAAVKKYITNVEETVAGFRDAITNEKDEEPIKENTFVFYREGKRYNMTVTPETMRALSVLNPSTKGEGEVLKAMRNGGDLFKKVNTAWDPIFLLWKNPLKDVQDAAFYSVDFKKFAKNYIAAGKLIRQSRKGKSDGTDYYTMYKAMGGEYSLLSRYDAKTGELAESGKSLVARMEAISAGIESRPRLAEFMTVLQIAKEEHGEITRDDLMNAQLAAADITTNFGRSGDWGKWLNTYLVPFFNPSVQGTDKFIRAITGNKGAKAWVNLTLKAAMLGIAPTLMNALLYRDDEDWDELDAQTKANYYLLKAYAIQKGMWIKIPKGRAIAVLSSPAVAIDEARRGNNVKASDIFAIVGDNVAPSNPFTSNIISAWVDTDLLQKDSPGRTWYGGQIEGRRMQNIPVAGERYDESTDEISKAVGKALNISPKKINYLLNQYTGVFGDVLLPLLTPKAEAIWPTKAFTVDATTRSAMTDRYYDKVDELEQAEYKGDRAAGITARYMNKLGDEVSDLYAEARGIQNDPNLTDSEKRKAVRAVYTALNERQKEIVAGADKYLAETKKVLREQPELDSSKNTAVRAWMDAYNVGKEADDQIDAEGAADRMEDIVYREANRAAEGAEYALKTYSKDVWEKAYKSGVEFDAYYDYYFGTKELTSDKDENGKTISGSLKKKVLAYIEDMDLTNEEKDALYYSAGYAKSGIGATPWHTGGGSGGGRGGSKKPQKVKSLALPAIPKETKRELTTAELALPKVAPEFYDELWEISRRGR